MRRYHVLTVAVLLLCLVVVMAQAPAALRESEATPTPLSRSDPFGKPIRTRAPVDLPDTAFLDQDGELVKLSALRGRVVLIVFTNIVCVVDSACVQPLPVYQKIKRALGARASQAAFVFVGVDPQKDTSDALRALVRQADPDFLGWFAPTTTLRPLTLRFGVHMNVSDGTLLAHAPFIYLLDRQGRLRVYVPKQSSVEDTLAEVELLLGEGQ